MTIPKNSPVIVVKSLRASSIAWRAAALFVWAGLALTLGSLARGADAPAAAAADFHTFTNDQNQSFNAKIVNVVDDAVTLKRDDGKSFNVKISTFQKDDQSFIDQWLAKQADTNHQPLLQLTASSSQTVAASTTDSAAHLTTSKWQEGYTLKIKNDSSVKWANLTVHYITVYARANPGQLKPGDVTFQYPNGNFTVDALDSHDEKPFATTKIDMQATAKLGNYYYTNGASLKTTDKLQALWIRIYDSFGNVLQEWSSAPEVTKTLSWDTVMPTKKAARAPRPARASGSTPPASGNPGPTATTGK